MFRRNISIPSSSSASSASSPVPAICSIDDTLPVVDEQQQQQYVSVPSTGTLREAPGVSLLSIVPQSNLNMQLVQQQQQHQSHLMNEHHRRRSSSSTASSYLPTPVKRSSSFQQQQLPPPPPAYSASASTDTMPPSSQLDYYQHQQPQQQISPIQHHTTNSTTPLLHSRVHSASGLSASSTTTTSSSSSDGSSSSPSVAKKPTRRHRVYGPFVEQQFGYHGQEFASMPEHIRFVPCNTFEARQELDELVRQWIVPTGTAKPVGAEGIFCGQISHKSYTYALALIASVIGVRIYSISPKFKEENGRLKGYLEFYVESGNAAKLVRASRGLVCCEDGGFWVAITSTGSDVMKDHKLGIPPIAQGVPQFAVTMDFKRSSRSNTNSNNRVGCTGSTPGATTCRPAAGVYVHPPPSYF